MGDVRAPRARAGLVLLPALLAAVLLGGCAMFDLFKPASPERPSGGSAVVVGNYTTPDSCLRYMALGLERKDNAGQDLYVGALADSLGRKDGADFHAAFDLVVWNNYTGVKPADWDFAYERQFYGSIIGVSNERYQMLWEHDIYHGGEGHDDEDHPERAERILHRRYLLRAIPRTGDTLVIAVGYADLTFKNLSTRWVLARWEDRLDLDIGYDTEQQTMGGRRLNAGL